MCQLGWLRQHLRQPTVTVTLEAWPHTSAANRQHDVSPAAPDATNRCYVSSAQPIYRVTACCAQPRPWMQRTRQPERGGMHRLLELRKQRALFAVAEFALDTVIISAYFLTNTCIFTTCLVDVSVRRSCCLSTVESC